MRAIILFCSLAFANITFAQESHLVFALYFGNQFINDTATVYVNGVQVVENAQLKPVMYDPFNLVLRQYQSRITVTKSDPFEESIKKLACKSPLVTLAISMNKVWKTFQLDLRKGKFLFAEYRIIKTPWTAFKVLSIRQSSAGSLIF